MHQRPLDPQQPTATSIDFQPQTKPDEQQSEGPSTPRRVRNVLFKALQLTQTFIFCYFHFFLFAINTWHSRRLGLKGCGVCCGFAPHSHTLYSPFEYLDRLPHHQSRFIYSFGFLSLWLFSFFPFSFLLFILFSFSHIKYSNKLFQQFNNLLFNKSTPHELWILRPVTRPLATHQRILPLNV